VSLKGANSIKCVACACRYGGIGGLSETIGWTEVQREENQSSFLGGLEGVIKLFSIILVADLLLFIYEQVGGWVGGHWLGYLMKVFILVYQWWMKMTLLAEG
jgi:hypothetical protein